MDAACQSNPKCCWKIPKLEISLTRTPTKSSKYPIQITWSYYFGWLYITMLKFGRPKFRPKIGRNWAPPQVFVSYHKLGGMISGCFWYMFLVRILEVAKVCWFTLMKFNQGSRHKVRTGFSLAIHGAEDEINEEHVHDMWRSGGQKSSNRRQQGDFHVNPGFF